MDIGVPEFVALSALILMVIAEAVHVLRVRRIAQLAFGPSRRPLAWSLVAPPARALAAAALAWGFATLLYVDPKIHNLGEIEESKQKHLILVIDVSPACT